MSSLADRISKPDSDMNSSWADETTNAASASSAAPGATSDAGKDVSDLAKSQTDGAADTVNGSGIIEPSYDVDVKLSDLQADPNDPLFSAKSFEELGL